VFIIQTIGQCILYKWADSLMASATSENTQVQLNNIFGKGSYYYPGILLNYWDAPLKYHHGFTHS